MGTADHLLSLGCHFITAPAHPHATLEAEIPALIFYRDVQRQPKQVIMADQAKYIRRIKDVPYAFSDGIVPGEKGGTPFKMSKQQSVKAVQSVLDHFETSFSHTTSHTLGTHAEVSADLLEGFGLTGGKNLPCALYRSTVYMKGHVNHQVDCSICVLRIAKVGSRPSPCLGNVEMQKS